MKINADRTVLLETEDCHWCSGKGTMPGRKTCPDCKGTRLGKRGGKDKCQTCFSFGEDRGKVADFDHHVTCSCCNGKKIEPETFCSRITSEFAASMFEQVPIRVMLKDRGITFNESWLGLGMIYSVGDYGSSHKAMQADSAATTAKIIAEVKAQREQLCKYAREHKETGIITLCKSIIVVVHRGGYSARPSFVDDGSDVAMVTAHEPSEQEGMLIGRTVAEAGGNGTLAAATGLIP